MPAARSPSTRRRRCSPRSACRSRASSWRAMPTRPCARPRRSASRRRQAVRRRDRAQDRARPRAPRPRRRRGGPRRGGRAARAGDAPTTVTSSCSSPRRCAGRRELIAGLVRDPQFGPCVVLGLGGILTEAFGDVVFAGAAALARGGARLIGRPARAPAPRDAPFRGEPAVDADALADVLRRPRRARRRARPTSRAST